MSFVNFRPIANQGMSQCIDRGRWLRRARYLSAFVALAALYGCAEQQEPAEDVAKPKAVDRSEGTRLNPTQVATIAKDAAKNEGIQLLDYEEPEVHYEFVRKDQTWTVFFTGKVARPGNHFSVYVEDQTGKAQVMRGE